MSDYYEAIGRFADKHLYQSNLRLHSARKPISLEDIIDKEQRIFSKPQGLWFATGDDWIRWCISEEFGGLGHYLYEIVLDENQLLSINDIASFEKLEEEYGTMPDHLKHLYDQFSELPYGLNKKRFTDSLNYPKIAERYGAIEITPYLYEKRLESFFYYGWDCASGCVWNKNAIKDIKLYAFHDENIGEFILEPQNATI